MSQFVTLGEIMLRLKSPGHERFFQSPTFEATFGGGEANVAVALANYGLEAGFISALPDNDIGAAAIRELRGFGVDTQHIRRSGDRVGIYYLESGANQRPSKVVYDRAGSSICQAQPGDFEWPEIFDGAKWLHITGITPALGEHAQASVRAACVAARRAGATVLIYHEVRELLSQGRDGDRRSGQEQAEQERHGWGLGEEENGAEAA